MNLSCPAQFFLCDPFGAVLQRASADQEELLVVECDAGGRWTGEPRSITESLDSSPDGYTWHTDSEALLFTADLTSTPRACRVASHHSVLRRWLAAST